MPVHPDVTLPAAVGAASPWKELSIPMDLDLTDPLDSMEPDDMGEPSDAELAAIELEWPLIEAELELLDAVICIANGTGVVTELDWRRLRRAQRRRLNALVELLKLSAERAGHGVDAGQGERVAA